MRSSLHNVRETAAALRSTLLFPPAEAPWAIAISAHVPALQEAVAMLDRLRGQAPGAGSREELEALASELHGLRRLIVQGIEFTQGMARLLAPANAAYRPDGEPVLGSAPGTILVRG